MLYEFATFVTCNSFMVMILNGTVEVDVARRKWNSMLVVCVLARAKFSYILSTNLLLPHTHTHTRSNNKCPLISLRSAFAVTDVVTDVASHLCSSHDSPPRSVGNITSDRFQDLFLTIRTDRFYYCCSAATLGSSLMMILVHRMD